MLPVNQIEFTSDTAHRKQWFRGLSFSHPAKMHLSLQIYLIEHYTKPGDTILDCMSGSGTLLVGCALGRNVICVELEKKFVDMQKANWEKIKALGPILGYKMGEAAILQGDARNLQSLLADSCIFSPPYEEAMGKKHHSPKADKLSKEKSLPQSYTSRPAVVISSPPYEGTDIKSPVIGQAHQIARKDSTKTLTYADKADVICTSPPYSEILGKGHKSKLGNIKKQGSSYADLDESVKRLRNHGRTDPKSGGPYGRS